MHPMAQDVWGTPRHLRNQNPDKWLIVLHWNIRIDTDG